MPRALSCVISMRNVRYLWVARVPTGPTMKFQARNRMS